MILATRRQTRYARILASAAASSGTGCVQTRRHGRSYFACSGAHAGAARSSTLRIRTESQIRTRNGFDQASLEELASTIKHIGLIEPLIVRACDDASGDYVLIAGERRLLAASLAGLAEVPTMVRSVTAQQAVLLQATENLEREPLCLSDVADAVAALVAEHGAKRTAAMLGKSPAWVSKHFAITKLHKDVRTILDSGASEDPELLNTLNAIRREDRGWH